MDSEGRIDTAKIILDALGSDLYSCETIFNETAAVCTLCKNDETKMSKYVSTVVNFENLYRHMYVSRDASD